MSSELTKHKKIFWHCPECMTDFVNETRYMQHYCKQAERFDVMSSNDGIAAYNHYCYWMKRIKRNPPDAETFQHSRYFTSILKFAIFCRTHCVTDPEKYIDIMVNRNNISPMLWTRDEFFSFYLDYCDNQQPPMDQLDISVKTIFAICEALEIKTSEFFNVVNYQEVFTLVQQNKISMWLLFASDKFKKVLSSLPSDERAVASRLINQERWIKRISENKETMNTMKIIAKEIGI